MLAAILRLAPWLMKAGPFIGILKGNAKLVVSVISILSVFGTYWYITHLQNDISELEGQAILYVSQIQQCQTANNENMTAIRALQAANTSLIDKVAVSDEVRENAAREAAERDRAAAAALRNTTRELEELRNANPSCSDLSSIDMGVVCTLVVDRLREKALGNQ